jgi:DNA-binding NarL/FixJ family response regulator
MRCSHCQYELTLAEIRQALTPDEARSLRASLSNALRTTTRAAGRKPALSAAQRRRALQMLAKGSTQTEVAAELGVSQATISKLANS